MANGSGSIEDLFGKSRKKKSHDDRSAQDKFSDKLREIQIKQKEAEVRAKAATIGVEYIDLVGFPISPEALELVPREQSQKLKAIPFLYGADEIRIGAVNPQDPGVEELRYQAAERMRANAKVYMISEHAFEVASKLYDTLPEIKTIVKGVEITEADLKKFQEEVKSIKDLDGHIQRVSTTDFIALVIATALTARSSDIHIEAEEKEVVVKYRVDGVLNRVASVAKDQWVRIINRIKLVSALKLNLTTVPQDGRFTIFMSEGQKTDVRVSTLPTSYGESVVMRLLMPSTIGLAFEQLGIRGRAYEQLKREVERPNGMIITTGPTGSGKTTTLYAVLKKLNDGHTKIITLEDPVEYKLAGVNQSQVDKSKDYTFAKGLNSILRQDPDVIMVGEIRELDTADVAIQAALTGHLLVSTIHTNSAAGAIPRFLSMGVKPFLLAPALNAVIAQRLVRKICQTCKQPATLEPDILERVKKILAGINPSSGYKVDMNNLTFFAASGCAACDGLGFKGRMGIYEIFAMSPEIEKVILGGAVSEYDMQDIAVKQGMVTMVQDGILKALDGITTVGEVFSVAE